MMNEELGVCTPKFLPREEWLEAAHLAKSIREDNVPEGAVLEALPQEGGRLALDINKYWGKKGVKLTVGFMDNPAADLRARILLHMNAWGKSANVVFTESALEPQVRIARDGGAQGGYWSYLGTDILKIPKNRPTMNLEGFTTSTSDREFFRVVRHEAGHTLGFPHEHMRKDLVAKLDREKVIADFMASQGWTRQDVINQVLTPLSESSVLGTPVDVTSIMCYQIAGRLTLDGSAIPGGLDINDTDHRFAAHVYPKQT